MPRNGSGTYTPPVNSTNPAVTLTEILATDFNELVSDLATALSQSLSRDGQTTTTQPIPFAQGVRLNLTGSATAPALSFIGDTNTGLYRVSADKLAISANGDDQIQVDEDQVRLPSGTVSLPGMAFIGDPNTGVFGKTADVVAITVGGVEAMELAAPQVKVSQPTLLIQGPTGDGTVAVKQASVLSVAMGGIRNLSNTATQLFHQSPSGQQALFQIDPLTGSGANVEVRLFRRTNTTGLRRMVFYRGDDSTTEAADLRINAGSDGLDWAGRHKFPGLITKPFQLGDTRLWRHTASGDNASGHIKFLNGSDPGSTGVGEHLGTIAKNLASDGYWWSTSSFIVQWGTVTTGGAGTASVTFSLAFTASPYAYGAMAPSSGATIANAFSVSTTGMTVRAFNSTSNANVSGATVLWWALGRRT